MIKPEDLFFNTYDAEKRNADRSLKKAINVFKSNFIQKVLEENKWNQTDAAKALGIQRTYLSRLMKELDIKDQNLVF